MDVDNSGNLRVFGQGQLEGAVAFLEVVAVSGLHRATNAQRRTVAVALFENKTKLFSDLKLGKFFKAKIVNSYN